MEATPTPAPTAPAQNLDAAVAELINKSVATLGEAKDFVVAQLPDVIQQLLAWRMTVALFYGVIFAALAIASAYLLVRACKAIYRSFEDDEETLAAILTPLILFGSAPWVTFALLSLSRILTALQIWVAPKVYIIEHAKELLK